MYYRKILLVLWIKYPAEVLLKGFGPSLPKFPHSEERISKLIEISIYIIHWNNVFVYLVLITKYLRKKPPSPFSADLEKSKLHYCAIVQVVACVKAISSEGEQKTRFQEFGMLAHEKCAAGS